MRPGMVWGKMMVVVRLEYRLGGQGGKETEGDWSGRQRSSGGGLHASRPTVHCHQDDDDPLQVRPRRSAFVYSNDVRAAKSR